MSKDRQKKIKNCTRFNHNLVFTYSNDIITLFTFSFIHKFITVQKFGQYGLKKKFLQSLKLTKAAFKIKVKKI